MDFTIGIQDEINGLCEGLCNVIVPSLTNDQLIDLIQVLLTSILSVLPGPIDPYPIIDKIAEITGGDVTKNANLVYGFGVDVEKAHLVFALPNTRESHISNKTIHSDINELHAFLSQ